MISKLQRAIRNPKKVLWKLFWLWIGMFKKFLIDLKSDKKYAITDLKELNNIKKYSLTRTDINDHLITLFIESLSIKPKVIVELGVRNGESTFVLERVARLCNSKLISVDIKDCSNASSYKEWIFVQKDDIAFAKGFKNFCKKHRILPKIDVLFIDTNHLYEHTLQEIEFWFPFLSRSSKVFFHDTNLKEVYFNKDGSIGFGWNNQRGVIRALEKYFNKSFNEKKEFIDFKKRWLIKHYPYCMGFTILERTSFVQDSSEFTS